MIYKISIKWHHLYFSQEIAVRIFRSEGRQAEMVKILSIHQKNSETIYHHLKNFNRYFFLLRKIYNTWSFTYWQLIFLVDLPVLVETTTTFFRQMLSPYVNQGTETEGCFDVTDSTNNNHGWSFQNGNSFNDLLLVYLCKIKIKNI